MPEGELWGIAEGTGRPVPILAGGRLHLGLNGAVANIAQPQKSIMLPSICPLQKSSCWYPPGSSSRRHIDSNACEGCDGAGGRSHPRLAAP